MKEEIKERIKAYYLGENISEVLDYITNLQEENERLNNIINELEKWLEEKIDEYAINLEYLSEERMYSVKNKLKELKEGNKDE